MPLFMDIHKISKVTIDDVKEAHLADLAVQEKYKVNYHQFWVNQEAGALFCLIEGPDKESCEAVHQEAHGNIACNIVEVEPGFYNLLMGENHNLDQGLVKRENGDLDLAYRYVLVVDIRGRTDVTSSHNYKSLLLPEEAKEIVFTLISRYQGNIVRNERLDYLTAAFEDPTKAVLCAIEINRTLKKKGGESEESEWNISFKMGLSGGQPLTEEDGFFEKVLKLAQRLTLIAGDREIIASNLVGKMNSSPKAEEHIRFLNSREEEFLNDLFTTVEKNISDNSFSVKKLSRNIGVSRSQLYRKVTSVAGCPPNRFIRNLRMQKALSLIKEEQFNISEVSLEVGFHNPSYFSKCFQEKYGVPPSKMLF